MHSCRTSTDTASVRNGTKRIIEKTYILKRVWKANMKIWVKFLSEYVRKECVSQFRLFKDHTNGTAISLSVSKGFPLRNVQDRQCTHKGNTKARSRNHCCRRKAALHILKTRIELYNIVALPVLLYGSETWTIKASDARRITAAEMKYMRRTAWCTWTDYKTNAQTAKELKITQIFDKLLEHKRSWIQHVNRILRNTLPRVMKYYSPNGRRNHGRPLKRLLDTWYRNASTSGPTPWKIYDDNDDDECVYVAWVIQHAMAFPVLHCDQ